MSFEAVPLPWTNMGQAFDLFACSYLQRSLGKTCAIMSHCFLNSKIHIFWCEILTAFYCMKLTLQCSPEKILQPILSETKK